MKPSRVSGILDHAVKCKRSVLMVGSPGICKSDLAKQSAARNNADFMLKHLAIEDPTDNKGLPALVNGGNKADFLPFGDLRRMMDTKKPLVVCVDDLIMSTPSNQAAFCQLLLARNIGGKAISDHVVFIGATNDVCDRAGGTGLIEPLKSRWDTILRVEVSLDDWCAWAFDNGQPAELVAFLRMRPELLVKFTPSREIKSYPCPRTWASVGRWFNEGMVDHEVYAGVVGEGAAVEFVAFLKTLNEAPSLDAILMNPDTAEVPKSPGIMYLVTGGLARKAERGNVERVLRYMGRLPKEFEVCCVRDAIRMKPALAQTASICKWYEKNADALGASSN